MNGLRTASITTFHQAETGAPSGIARIVQAATAPNEGQCLLQGELHENTMQGESRERTSTTTDAAGNVFTQRLAERSVLMEDGRSVHVQQSQQGVAQVCDNNILLAAINQGQTDVRDFKDIVMYKIEQGLAKESKARELALQKESEARELALQNEGEARELAFQKEGEARELALQKEGEARELALQKEGEARELAFQKEGEARELALQKEGAARELAFEKEGAAREQACLVLELKNSALEKRLTDLEQGGTSSNKKPRKADKIVIKQRNNIISWTLNGTTVFGWSKMVRGETRTKKGFSSADAAMLDMDRFYAASRQ